ncbi:MAG: hypothetical protein GXN98_01210 [Euryarchaeota archaeon]|nr:hypothetical protein [Euryarchaeota archaeon]
MSRSGALIFRGREYPPLYAEVVTRGGECIGRVVDIIGPASHPYFVVVPEKEPDSRVLEDAKAGRVYVKKEERRRSFGKGGRIQRQVS